MRKCQASLFAFYHDIEKPCIDDDTQDRYFSRMDKTGRLPRIHISNTIHHVMVRGNNRQRIFFNDKYFERFLEIITQSAEKFDHKILSYCLMSNHAHLVIYIHESPLSQVMQYINFRYACWLNQKQKRIGHLFQGRYRSIEVCNDEYLVNLFRYVHLNPVTAHMVKNASDYQWSSINYYINANAPDWMNTEIVISALNNRNINNLIEFINNFTENKTWKPGLYLSESGKIIADKDIVQQINKKNSSAEIKKKSLPSNVVFSVVCDHLQIKLDVLCSEAKNHKLSKQRMLLAYYALKYSHIKMSEIAKLFQRTHATLARQLTRFSHHPDNYFSTHLLDKIEQDLNSAC